MQTGFGMLESGCVSLKNEVNIMMKNVVDVVLGNIVTRRFFYMKTVKIKVLQNLKTNSASGNGDQATTTNESKQKHCVKN